jgi:Uma2 family endonuclease
MIGSQASPIPLVRPEFGTAWTIEDLWRLPDDGFRYEIIDGSLLVSPPPAIPHVRVTTRLRNLLHAHAPDDLVVGENAGVSMAKGRTYRIPDLAVVRASAIEGDETEFVPEDVVLAVEVLPPDSGGDDLVMKRYQYGKAGIPLYWIVDQRKRTLTVLRHDGTEGYVHVATVSPGEVWRGDEPFPLVLDPAAFL